MLPETVSAHWLLLNRSVHTCGWGNLSTGQKNSKPVISSLLSMADPVTTGFAVAHPLSNGDREILNTLFPFAL